MDCDVIGKYKVLNVLLLLLVRVGAICGAFNYLLYDINWEISDRRLVDASIKNASEGAQMALSGWMDIKTNLTDEFCIELSLLHSRNNLINYKIAKITQLITLSAFVEDYYKPFLLGPLQKCAPTAPTGESAFKMPLQPRRLDFHRCNVDADFLLFNFKDIKPNYFYMFIVEFVGQWDAELVFRTYVTETTTDAE